MTIKAAPSEITDYLSNLKQALLEERRHLRKVRKRVRSARRHPDDSDAGDWGPGHSGGAGASRRHSRGRRGKHVRGSQFDRDEQSFRSAGESETLRVMRTAVRDMIRSFRQLEYPFLKPEFQNLDSAHWSTNTPYSPPEKAPYHTQPPYPYSDDDDAGLRKSNRLGSEYRVCGLRERWLWLRRKGDVLSLSENLSRVEVRTAHEVGQVLMAVEDIGRDVQEVMESVAALEGRLNRVVGVRRVE